MEIVAPYVVGLKIATNGIGQYSSIIKIEMVKYDSSTFNYIDKFVSFVKPSSNVNFELGAYLRNGIKKDDLTNAPSFKDISSCIINFIKDSCIVGYGIKSFDIPFLSRTFASVGVDVDFTTYEVVDVLDVENKINGLKEDMIFERYFSKSRKSCRLDTTHELGSAKSSIMIMKKQKELGVDYSTHLLTNDNFLVMVDISDFPYKFDQIVCDKDNNVVCFNVGKYKGCPVSLVKILDKSYIDWTLSCELSEKTKNIIRNI